MKMQASLSLRRADACRRVPYIADRPPEKDVPLIVSAIQGKCDLLVTGGRKDFGALARRSSLPFRIVTTPECVTQLGMWTEALGARRYINRERMDRSANARTERGASPRTRTAAAEMHRAREKAVRGGRGTGISAGAGSMYM